MFAIQNVSRRIPQLSKQIVNQRRTLLCTPPRVKVTSSELLTHGIILYAGIMAIPVYIGCNIKNYAKSKGD